MALAVTLLNIPKRIEEDPATALKVACRVQVAYLKE